MTTLLASPLSGLVALALTQSADGLGLSELSRAVGAVPSSVQRALEVLLGAGVVARREDMRPSYAVLDGPPTEPFLALAGAVTPVELVIGAIARANPGVEFASFDDRGALLVTGWNADTESLLRLEQATRRLAVPVTVLDHDALRERLPDEPGLRDRAAGGNILKGTISRSFPDRTLHGDMQAPGLGHLNLQILEPSRRAITRLARQFGLDRVAVFGSAVRADLRPDSDVDVLVEPRPGVHLGLADHAALRTRLEDLFERDVDVVNARFVRPEILRRAQEEGVVLFGRP